jgi:beta-lactamase class D
MQRLAPSLVMLLATFHATADETVARPEWRKAFEARGARGTFVLYEPERHRFGVLDEARARHRYLPASTFKIPNALIGLEVGSIRDENEVFKWDGKPKTRPALERDHTLNSGMADSVLPMFQEIARRTGKARMREWMERFGYGNRDIGGGIDLFWLQGSMRISAFEQIAFLRKLEEGRLPVSARSRRLVRDALVIERTPAYTLYAKTGSSGLSVKEPVQWWVGWVEKQGRPVAYFAMNLTPTKETKFGDRFEITREILRDLIESPPA